MSYTSRIFERSDDFCNAAGVGNALIAVEGVTKLDKKGNVKNNHQKASCLTGGGHSGGNHSDMDIVEVVSNRRLRLRRLTPLECGRLQTIPTWYVWDVSNSQQYRMLGNGWTIEVVKHILSYMEV